MLVLKLTAVSILIAGGPAGVWGEPPDLPNLNTWVTNGAVNAIASVGAITYIGGYFTYVGPQTGCGASISEVTGRPSPPYLRSDGSIVAVAPDGSGGWYIGGAFTSVGGVERNRIAHVLPDGFLDTSWKPNANDSVIAAGGERRDGLCRRRVHEHRGESEKPHCRPRCRNRGDDTLEPKRQRPRLLTLAVSGGTVYAGGWFTSIGGQARSYIAALDAVTGQATSWNPMRTTRFLPWR